MQYINKFGHIGLVVIWDISPHLMKGFSVAVKSRWLHTLPGSLGLVLIV